MNAVTLQLVSQHAASALISSIWQGFLLAAAVALALRLTPRISATTRFAIWTAAFLVLALLPILHIPHATNPTPQPLLQLNPYWSLAIAALWTLASLVRATALIRQALQLRTLSRQSIPVSPQDLLPATLDLRGAQLCTSPNVDRPSLIGFFSPRILIPTYLFDRITPAELHHIVLHELEHLRRRDDWLNLIQKLSLVLFPLNPVLPFIDKHLCLQRELACDDGVIRATRTPRAYATSLTNLAERGLHHRSAELSLGAWERRPQLVHRVHSILRSRTTLSPLQSRAILATLTLGLITGAAELSRCPQLIAFTAPETQPFAANTSSTASPQIENVRFNASPAFHATMLNANMDAPRPHQPAAKPHRTNLKSSRKAPTTPAPQLNQSWMVVTSWQQATPSRIVLTVLDDSNSISTFTAVPTDGGWLFVQL
jgi:beta-lactamase regulating signal transducer with metallopeptidase domain